MHSPNFLNRLTSIYLIYLLIVGLCKAQDLLATLDYGTFQGSYSSTYNINYWRKIPFAAPPVGENRFRAPQPPIPITNGTYNSDQSFDYCPQRTVNGTEDCLYLGLYSRPWTPTQPLRPVVINFFGGAFIEGGGSFTIPPAAYPILNVSTFNNFIIIIPNYRVNAFGFLPGKQIASSPTSDLNPGLLDQRAVLNWTNRYIHLFGGDKRNVSIWGQSAGAGSVVAQVIAHAGSTANGENDEGERLFNNALLSSPFWPKAYRYDDLEAQAVYDSLVNLTGCSPGLSDSDSDSVACLKAVDVQSIRTAALRISGSHTWNTSSYTWAPVIDGVFLTQSLSEATRKGEVNIDFGFGMYNQHEGENFVPPGLQNLTNTGTPPFNSSTLSFQTWLSGFLPRFTPQDLSLVEEFYPPSGTAEEFPTYNTSYERAGLIYRDVVLACPSYWIARSARARKSYLGTYTISPARHGSDTVYWNQVNTIQKTQPLIYEGFAGAFASFFQTGDPNAHKLTNGTEPGVPENWETGEEFVVETTGFSNVRVDLLDRRCGFWRDVAHKVPL